MVGLYRCVLAGTCTSSGVCIVGEEYRDVDADMYSDTSSMTGVSAVSSSHTRSTGFVLQF